MTVTAQKCGVAARATVEQLLARHPGFSLPFAEQKLFYLKRDDQRRLYLDALARAGVPAS
ncbi:MAG: hypothetical protein IT179_18795 [Acidobacteria bacterium]|nr:hypothetical protein [Acidobacteriota bacterium]